jgi:hypothetical protein
VSGWLVWNVKERRIELGSGGNPNLFASLGDAEAAIAKQARLSQVDTPARLVAVQVPL